MKKEGFGQRVSTYAQRARGSLPYEETVKLLRFLFSKLPHIAVGLLFARTRLFLSVAPLGTALAAAAGENLPYFALGGLLYTLPMRDIAGTLGVCGVLILRVAFVLLHDRGRAPTADGGLFSKEKKRALVSQSLTLRLAASAGGGFAAGAVRTVLGGGAIGDLLGLFLYIGLSPLFTYLFCAARQSENARRRAVGRAVFFALVVFAVAPFSLFGFSFAYALAAAFAFTAANKQKPPVAALFGAVLLLPLSPTYAAALAAAAFCAAWLYPRSTLYAVCGGSLLFAAVGFLLGGARGFAAAFPEVMAGAAVAAYLVRKKSLQKDKIFSPPQAVRSAADAAVLSAAAEEEKADLLALADAAEQMANTFFSLSDRAQRPQQLDARSLCEDAFDRLCRRCPAAKVCFGRAESRAVDAQNKLAARLADAGQVKAEDLPEEFAAFCPHVAEILEEIEISYAGLLERRLKNDGRFSAYAGALSSLIRHALTENENAYAPNPTARRACAAALAEIGFTADALGVYGAREKRIYACRLSSAAMHCKVEDIRSAIERALDAPVETPTFSFVDGGITMSCKSLPCFAVESDMTSAAWDLCEENGDSVRMFEGKGGYTYALISDGMGRGHLAAEKSRRAALFLEKMLSAGNSVRTAIELLSVLLRSENDEGFTTVDLLEIDRHLGKVCFFKSGAAPSFVRRGDRIFKIRSRTFPIGILEDVDAEKNTFAAVDGDLIVMVSDGIVGEYDEPLWLCKLLAEGNFDASGAAHAIRRAAEAHAMSEDDRSVCVLQITDCRRGAKEQAPAPGGGGREKKEETAAK